ncbi:MAG: hypothetical protein HOG49_31710 [Candidatus Scalindua sp.]|jgi:hypothetical protein|nr:hypothetical protein [Candidatus Scalindua sp.]
MAKDKELVPMCWKCASKIVKEKENGVTVLTGCKESSKIKDYDDAKKHCPCFPD